MSLSTNLPRDIIAKLFRTLHNPGVHQDWWFLLNPNDKSHFASNNNVICINCLFHISDSEWLYFLSKSNLVQKRGNHNNFRLNLNNLDSLKIEFNLSFIYTAFKDKVFLSFNENIDTLPKELFSKKNKFVLNLAKMRDNFSKDLLEAIHDIKEFIDNGR